jgi:ABC-type multidrug transport system fused ATPase/permease subunit
MLAAELLTGEAEFRCTTKARQSLRTQILSKVLETYAAAERLFLLGDREPMVKEASHPQETRKIREIRFDRIDFHYTDKEHPILKGFDLNITGPENISHWLCGFRPMGYGGYVPAVFLHA